MPNWSGLNRRNFPRINFPCLVTIATGSKTTSNAILTHTQNVGIGGICVLISEDVKNFYSLKIELDLMDLGDHIKCKGKVVWNVPNNTNGPRKKMYDIGIEFEDLNEKDRKRILQSVEWFLKNSNESRPNS